MTDATTMVSVKYAFVYEDVDRHGNVRLYFWRGRGHRKVRLRESPGTLAFASHYEELLKASDESPEPKPEGKLGRSAVTTGTWRWLCIQYFASARFRGLDPTTQKKRRAILESTLEEPIFPGATETFSNLPYVRMGPKHVRVLRDRKGSELPAAANLRIKAIGNVFSWAVEQEHTLANPARDVQRIKMASTGWHSWTPEEVETFETFWPIGSTPRLAMALLLYTGVRRSDVVRLGPQHAREGWLKFKQHKGRNRHPIEIEFPILPQLQAILDASEIGNLAFLVSAHGRPYTEAGFGMRFRKWCDKAGLRGCSAHGLRKAGAAIAAENGASEHQLMSIFGWRTIQEAERYTRAARRKKMAADAMPMLLRKTKE